MTQWCLLVLAAFVLVALGVPVKDDPIAFKNATWEKCQKQENAPDDAMKDLYLFKSVEGIKDHKCVMKCIDEEYGILQQDGKISKDMIKKAIMDLWKDPQNQEKLISAIPECGHTVKPGLELCQLTYNMMNCFVEVVKKKRLTLD